MKRVFFLFLLTLLSNGLYAQTEGIKFIDNPLWKDALALAAKENKLIFMDCYTTWCGPCKALAKDVFPNKELGEFMNAKFLNVKMDMEKGDGVDLNKKYKEFIPGYPTMLVINAQGEVVHRAVGFMSAPELIKAMENGLNGKTVASMSEKYAKGENSIAFIKDYLEVLNSVFMRDEMAALVDEYVKSLPIEKLKEKEVIELYMPYIKDIYTPQYEYIIKNMTHYNYRLKDFDRYPLNEQVNRTMERAVKDIVSFRVNDNGVAEPLDAAKEKIEKIRKYFYAYSFRDRQGFNARLVIHELNVDGNYEKAIDLINASCDLKLFGYAEQMILTEYTNFYLNTINDKKLFSRLLVMLQNKEIEIDPEKREDDFNFYEALSKTYAKVGDKKQAAMCKAIADSGREKMQAKFKEIMKK